MTYLRPITGEPDTLPIEIPWAPGLYADWITKDMVDDLRNEKGRREP